MKKVNAKKMMAAWNALKKAKETLRDCKKYESVEKIDAAQSAVDAAREEYDAATEKLREAIATAEGRATARTVTADDIMRTLKTVEDRVGNKTALAGTVVRYDGGQKFANAYKAIPQSTHWTAEYKSGHWTITDISRSTCPNRQSSGRVEYSDTAKAAIIERASVLSW